MQLDTTLTRHPVTGAVRPVTPALLAEVYLAPRAERAGSRGRHRPRRALGGKPCRRAGRDRAGAVGGALGAGHGQRVDDARGVAARGPAGGPRPAPPGGAEGTLAAQSAAPCPRTCAASRHVLTAHATDALEPLPIVEAADDPFALPAEDALRARLVVASRHASQRGRTRFRPGDRPSRPGRSAISRRTSPGPAAAMPLDGTLTTWGLRDPAEEAAFAAALVQRMLEDGRLADPSEAGPAGAARRSMPSCWPRRSTASACRFPAARPRRRATSVAELLGQLLTLLEGAGPAMALAAVVTSPLMPWPAGKGSELARQVMQYGSLRADGAAAPLLAQLRPAVTTSGQLMARLASDRRARPVPRRRRSRRLGPSRAAACAPCCRRERWTGPPPAGRCRRCRRRHDPSAMSKAPACSTPRTCPGAPAGS